MLKDGKPPRSFTLSRPQLVAVTLTGVETTAALWLLIESFPVFTLCGKVWFRLWKNVQRIRKEGKRKWQMFCYLLLELSLLFLSSLVVHASGNKYFARGEITTHNFVFQHRLKRYYSHATCSTSAAKLFSAPFFNARRKMGKLDLRTGDRRGQSVQLCKTQMSLSPLNGHNCNFRLFHISPTHPSLCLFFC